MNPKEREYPLDTNWIQNPAMILITLGGLIAFGALGTLILVRRRPKRARRLKREPETSTQTLVLDSTKNAPALALLKDMSGITGQVSHDIAGKRTEIGRVAGSDTTHVKTLIIDDVTISRQHAFIEYRDGGYWIRDRGSANGTFVNNKKITGEKLLKHGDRVRFHKFEFEFVVPPIGDVPETVFMPSLFINKINEKNEQQPLSAGASTPHSAADAAIANQKQGSLRTDDTGTTSSAPKEEKK